MNVSRRRLLRLAAITGAASSLSSIASAQTYPTKPIRLIVGFAAGGGQDQIARLLGQGLSERLGQQILIENRPGAGTIPATEAVINAPV